MKNILSVLKQFFIQLNQLFTNHAQLFFQLVATFLLPIRALIFLVGLLIIIDTISGIWKAKKTHQAITSRKLSAVISKMVLYQAGVILFFVLEKYMLGEFVRLFTSMPYFFAKCLRASG